MRDSEKYEASGPRNIAATVMIILAAAMIGGSFGILIADRGAMDFLKNRIAGRTAGYTDRTVTPNAKSETPATKASDDEKPLGEPEGRILQTGLSAIGAIHYSPKSDSALFTFDLESAKLVGTGELSSPDRIYVDLQNKHQALGIPGRLKVQKVIPIDGNLVAKARIAQRESGEVRVVLDLKRSCRFSYQIPPGDNPRLIVELRPRTAAVEPAKLSKPKTISRRSRWIVAQYPK